MALVFFGCTFPKFEDFSFLVALIPMLFAVKFAIQPLRFGVNGCGCSHLIILFVLGAIILNRN